MPALARLALAVATLFWLIGVSAHAQGTGASATASITGTVAYRQRIVLPPGASLQVGLEDVTRQDAPARVVSEMKFPVSGKQVPLPFQLPYSQADIDPSHRYSVRAAILVGDTVKFRSTNAYPVITGGAPADVAIMIEAAGPAPRARTFDIPLPATFGGDLPCADCAGLRYTLTLRSDDIFLLRRTYLQAAGGKDESFHDIGRWSLENGDTRFVLRGGKEAPEQFAVKDARTLRKLDTLGHVIASKANHDLKRADRVNPIADSFRMSGEFAYLADAGFFTECRSGLRLPVAQEGDNAALERAYGAARSAPGAPLLVTLDGQFARRPKREGSGEEEKLIVERFDRVWPGEHCASRAAAATLEGTFWRLMQVGGQPVAVLPNMAVAHLILQPDGRKLAGSGGCNRLLGAYELGGEDLRITPGPTTLMACPDPLMLQERSFSEALRATTGYGIRGDELELRDGQRLLARFKAQTPQ